LQEKKNGFFYNATKDLGLRKKESVVPNDTETHTIDKDLI
jgi:hypothetical protein